MESILNKVYAQYGFLGLIIVYLIWDRWRDLKIEHESNLEVEKKKRDGTYVSWESMRDRISVVEKRVNEHDRADAAAFEEVRIKKAIQDEKNAHFTETLIRLEKGQDNIYQLISEVKSFLMNLEKK